MITIVAPVAIVAAGLATLFLIADFARLRVIRFQRESRRGTRLWEIAFSEEHLQAKLNGEMAEVIMPEKPLVVRLWRWLRPLRPIEISVTGEFDRDLERLLKSKRDSG